MKVIFIKNLKRVAQVNEVKEVPDGYALNFLIPQGYAKPATEQNLKKVLSKQKKKQRNLQNYKRIAKNLKNFELRIKLKADKNGKLFASVTKSLIQERLKKQNLDIDQKFIKLQKPIKQVGEYFIPIDFGNSIKADLKLVIQPE